MHHLLTGIDKSVIISAKKTELIPSGMGEIPYRRYSPRALWQDPVKLRSRQYSLDGRRIFFRSVFAEAGLISICNPKSPESRGLFYF